MSRQWEPTKEQLSQLHSWAERLVSAGGVIEPEDSDAGAVNERKNVVLWLLSERRKRP